MKARHKERWLPVVGYEGWYEVSNYGRVKRVRKGKGTTKGKLLKPNPSNAGYLYVDLYVKGKVKRRPIHQLVCEAFVGPRPSKKHIVNHDDGQVANNYFENLEWATKSRNAKHAYDVLGVKAPKGSESKLSRTYVVTSPKGRVRVIKGLKEFCRKKGLDSGTMTKVAQGKYPSHKGWNCSYGKES